MQIEERPIYDVLILGDGPSGLATALALGRSQRHVLVLSHHRWRNEHAPAMHAVPLADGQPPSFLSTSCKAHIRSTYSNVVFHDKPSRIEKGRAVDLQVPVSQRRMTDAPVVPKSQLFTVHGYELTDTNGVAFFGRKIVWAAGSEDELRGDVPGLASLWPRLVHHCIFCDGADRAACPSGIGILAYPFKPLYNHMALQLWSLGARCVIIYTNGNELSAPELKSLSPALNVGCSLNKAKIDRLEAVNADESLLSSKEQVRVVFADGSDSTVGFLMHKPRTIPTSRALAEELGITNSKADAPCDQDELLERKEPCGDTSRLGIYVVGDAGTQAKQVTIAISHGIWAADCIWSELIEEDYAMFCGKPAP